MFQIHKTFTIELNNSYKIAVSYTHLTELIGAVDMISAQMQIISVQGIDIPFRSIKELNLYDMTI